MELFNSEIESERTSAFSNMLKNEELTDVTIALEDDQIKAHKVFLSAASMVFRNIFNKNTHKHPLLYFHDIAKDTMELILEFIYSGQVRIPLVGVESFFRAANNLKVEGLVDVKDKSNNLNKTDSKFTVKKLAEIAPADISSNDTSDVGGEVNNDMNVVNLSVAVLDESTEEEIPLSIKIETSNQGESASDYEEIDTKVRRLLMKSHDGTWGCKECSYKARLKRNVKDHVEQHIEGYAHPCNLCAKVFKNRPNLRTHKIRCVRKSALISA